MAAIFGLGRLHCLSLIRFYCLLMKLRLVVGLLRLRPLQRKSHSGSFQHDLSCAFQFCTSREIGSIAHVKNGTISSYVEIVPKRGKISFQRIDLECQSLCTNFCVRFCVPIQPPQTGPARPFLFPPSSSSSIIHPPQLQP